MEKLKRTAAKRLVEDYSLSIERVYASVEQDLLSARNGYSPSSHSNHDWCLMLFLDGCFIIEFIYRSMLNIKKHDRDLVCRDLLLLENQLPFQVLVVLARAFRIPENRLQYITEKFLFKQLLTISSYIKYNIFKSQMHHPLPAPVHLLQLFRHLWIKFPSYFVQGKEEEEKEEENEGKENDVKKEMKRKENGPICEPLSVTELKKMGIRCSSNNKKYFGLSFIQLKSFVLSGTLFLPPLNINEGSTTLLLNLVAFEFSCSAQDKTIGVWSYLNLMNMLIQGEEDVKELRARGQINSISSDQQVVDLLRYITAHEAPNHQAYRHVKQHIFTYSKTKILFPLRVLLAELKHRYFRGPWSFLVFLAVLFTVSMSVIQTVLTGIQTYKK